MDYEQKYKEALERAKEIIECSKSDTKEVRMVLSFFPELAESEDERMKNAAIRACKYMIDNFENSTKDYEDAIAWLEKKCEQKRQMPLVKSVSTDFKDRLGTFMQYTSVDLEKEENQQLLDEAAKELLQLAYSDKANEIALASAKTWEESMAILMAANNAYSRGQKEQKPAEWSEEDEAIYYGVIETEQYMLDVVNGIKKFNVGNISIKEECTRELNWLKSLKDRYTWKPCDYELEVLRLAAEKDGTCLMGLYEQLKKL